MEVRRRAARSRPMRAPPSTPDPSRTQARGRDGAAAAPGGSVRAHAAAEPEMIEVLAAGRTAERAPPRGRAPRPSRPTPGRSQTSLRPRPAEAGDAAVAAAGAADRSTADATAARGVSEHRGRRRHRRRERAQLSEREAGERPAQRPAPRQAMAAAADRPRASGRAASGPSVVAPPRRDRDRDRDRGRQPAVAHLELEPGARAARSPIRIRRSPSSLALKEQLEGNK